MNYLQFTDFRNKSKEYFDKIEKGKPVAKIIPFKGPVQGWKRERKTITLKSDKTTLDFLLEERNEK